MDVPGWHEFPANPCFAYHQSCTALRLLDPQWADRERDGWRPCCSTSGSCPGCHSILQSTLHHPRREGHLLGEVKPKVSLREVDSFSGASPDFWLGDGYRKLFRARSPLWDVTACPISFTRLPTPFGGKEPLPALFDW